MYRFKRTATFLAFSVVERGQTPFAGTAHRVLRTKRGQSPFPSRLAFSSRRLPAVKADSVLLRLSLRASLVVDDEPAQRHAELRRVQGGTAPTDHILHIWEVWRVGGHPLYHHDMFQTGYGTPSCPPDGIPDPEFSPYHRQVFEFLQHRARYQPSSKP